MKGERFVARVTDDTHRDSAGALVPDGCVELVAPGYGGEHKLKWVPPVTRGVHVVPIVGTTVRLLVDDGQLHWEPMDGDEGLPAWMQTGYPERSGMQSRSGSLQVAFDEDDGDGFVHVGLAGAKRQIGLWPNDGALHGLRAVLLDIIGAIESTNSSHKHPLAGVSLMLGAPTIPPTPLASGVTVVLGVSSGSTGTPTDATDPDDARTWTEADEPQATKVKAV